MPYRASELVRLVRADTDAATDRIITAHLATRGNTTHAARLLDVSHRSLRRYIRSLKLDQSIEAIRKNSRKK